MSKGVKSSNTNKDEVIKLYNEIVVVISEIIMNDGEVNKQ